MLHPQTFKKEGQEEWVNNCKMGPMHLEYLREIEGKKLDQDLKMAKEK